MLRSLILVFLAMIVYLPWVNADTRTASPIDLSEFIYCPTVVIGRLPPDFDDGNCTSAGVRQVDPQGRVIWVKTDFFVPDDWANADEPFAIFVSGSASTQFYLNGQYIGQNGRPGESRQSEIPGRMDAVIYVPPGIFIPGRNELAALMSSQSGLWRLMRPIHHVRIGPYANPADKILRRYWPSFIPLGVFIIGALYFGVMAFNRQDPRGSTILSLSAAFAASQLFAEVARGLVNYTYPFHQVRLLLIAAFSVGFGFCIAAYVLRKFAVRLTVRTLSALLLSTFLLMALIPGFDAKAIAGVLAPTVSCALLMVYLATKRQPQALTYFIVLATFGGIIVAAPGLFLNATFFYAVAILLLFLFADQALTLTRERHRLREEEARSASLALALEEAKQESGARVLHIKKAGDIEIIPIDSILHCDAAGDYVEIHMIDRAQHLHSGSLNELEKRLPSTFLRVHRSHIVNRSHIKSLKRLDSGVGELHLTSGAYVSVSRRIMPKVRKMLTK